jgi:hypothetical protein
MTANIGLYYYCYNPSGITSTADGEALSKLLQAHLAVINNSTRRDADFQQYFMHVLNIQMDVFELTGRPILLENRKVNISVLKGKQKLKVFALNLLGIRYLCVTNKYFHYIWRNR